MPGALESHRTFVSEQCLSIDKPGSQQTRQEPTGRGMSRRFNQAPVSVDALLPSLGALSVNGVSTPKQAPISAGDGGDDSHWMLPQDPGTGQPVQWVKGGGKLDQDARKRLVYAQNKNWISFYPPPIHREKAEDYDYENEKTQNWTIFFPGKNNMQIKNPHWLRAPPDTPFWPGGRHTLISEARTNFVDILVQNLREFKPATKENDNERFKREADINDRSTSLAELRRIIANDAEKTDLAELEQSRALIDPMFRSDGVFGHTKRKKSSFPLPPGWMTMYKPRSVQAMQAELDRNKGTKKAGRPGAYCDPWYVGPQYASWLNISPTTRLYSAVQQKTPIFAWLVYLMYQNSGSTHDPGELARRTNATESSKEKAAETRALREQQRKRKTQERDEDKAAAKEKRSDAPAKFEQAVLEENRSGDAQKPAEDEPADVELPGDELMDALEDSRSSDQADIELLKRYQNARNPAQMEDEPADVEIPGDEDEEELKAMMDALVDP